jgi:hypothetical protein
MMSVRGVNNVMQHERSSRRWVRRAVMSACSVLVLVLAAAYVLGPGGEAVAVSAVRGLDPGPSASHQGPSAVSGGGAPGNSGPALTEVIYGSITAGRGLRVSAADVFLAGTGRQAGRSARIAVGSPAAYRAVLHLPAGLYVATVSVTANGRRISAAYTLRLSDDGAYDVSATVKATGIFALLPIALMSYVA